MTSLLLPSILCAMLLSAGDPSAGEVEHRLLRLETESKQLRQEIESYRQTVERLPPTDPPAILTDSNGNEGTVIPSSLSAAHSPSVVPSPSVADPSASTSPTEFPIDSLKGEMQKMAWGKGPFKFTPYGRLWLSMSYDTQRTQVGDYVLWVDSPDVRRGDEFQVDARSTRIGCDVAGPEIGWLGGAKTGGKVEIDFQGLYVTRNDAGILLRHAYGEVKNDEYRVLAGQTWDVISPLAPPTFNYTAGSAAGNLAYRRAQFRLERFLPCSDTFLITLQTAAGVDVIVPYAASTRVFADHSSWPDWQNRVAFTFGERKAKDAQPIEIGVSGHVGEQDFDYRPLVGPPQYNVKRPSWSLCLDAKIPLTQKVGVQGEIYTGSNLSNYFCGIMQGVDPVTLNAIRDNGIWASIWYNPRPDWHWNVGYSLDDPVDSDITVGRLYNQYLFANVVYDMTKALNVGVEVASWETLFTNLSPGEATRIEALVRYNF